MKRESCLLIMSMIQTELDHTKSCYWLIKTVKKFKKEISHWLYIFMKKKSAQIGLVITNHHWEFCYGFDLEEDLLGEGICFEGQGCLLSSQGLQMGDLIMPGVSNLIPRASSYPGHGKKIGISHELDAKRWDLPQSLAYIKQKENLQHWII